MVENLVILDFIMMYILLIGIPLILGIYAQIKVTSAFKKYKAIMASSGVTGAEVARDILQRANIHDVDVVAIDDFLGDHYDPLKKRLCLSSDVYSTASIASLGIAAHECGHAIQHARAYAPLAWRMSIVPVTQIASQILPFILIGGILFNVTGLITLGIICYLVLAIFQLITLPVEFDASRRAKVILSELGYITPGAEANGVSTVLGAAALTYVAAFVAAIANLIYLFLIRRN
jgi:Zn-dependent membrane protease YugP